MAYVTCGTTIHPSQCRIRWDNKWWERCLVSELRTVHYSSYAVLPCPALTYPVLIRICQVLLQCRVTPYTQPVSLTWRRTQALYSTVRVIFLCSLLFKIQQISFSLSLSRSQPRSAQCRILISSHLSPAPPCPFRCLVWLWLWAWWVEEGEEEEELCGAKILWFSSKAVIHFSFFVLWVGLKEFVLVWVV
jgi:hypothetical protein